MDARYRDYARLVLTHSLQLKAGESVLIQASADTFRFAEIVAEEVIRKGGLPELWAVSETYGVVRIKEGNEQQINYVSPLWNHTREFDCRISIDAPSGRRFSKMDPDKLAKRHRALGDLYADLRKMRWVRMLLPTHYLARRLGMSWAECQDYFFRATVGADWTDIAARGEAIKRLFDGRHAVRILADGTDLRFDLGGRPGKVACGRINMPDGETYYSPVHETVEGRILFPTTQFCGAGGVEGMQLTFHDGRVVDASARRGMDVLHANLSVDEGALSLGEFGIGTNPAIEQITGNILFDEKIAGTIHVALGESFAELGGTNRSAIHWDLIFDLRRGGEVWLDGELVCQNGVWSATSTLATAVSA